MLLDQLRKMKEKRRGEDKDIKINFGKKDRKEGKGKDEQKKGQKERRERKK